MNLTLLLSLKKGWDLIKTKFFPAIIKYRGAIIVGLLLIYIAHQDKQIEYERDVADDVRIEFRDYKIEQEKALADAIIKGKETEAQLLNKQIELEREYNEKLKEVSADAITTNNQLNSLHGQIERNNANIVSKITDTQARAYTESLSNVFKDCGVKYVGMARIADEATVKGNHAINLYNSLVDGVNKEEQE